MNVGRRGLSQTGPGDFYRDSRCTRGGGHVGGREVTDVPDVSDDVR